MGLAMCAFCLFAFLRAAFTGTIDALIAFANTRRAGSIKLSMLTLSSQPERLDLPGAFTTDFIAPESDNHQKPIRVQRFEKQTCNSYKPVMLSQ